jgi:hypothetical protein
MVAKPMVNSVGTLADVIERILDKGLVINADITVSVVGVELLGIKIRAALASFETAARYGLEFPTGANLATPSWQAALAEQGGWQDWPGRHEWAPLERVTGEGPLSGRSSNGNGKVGLAHG